MKITRLGHAMFLLTSKEGKRYLIDPFFAMNPGCPEEYATPEFMKTLDAVFLTHGHFDHTSGLAELKAANPNLLVVAQYDLGMLLLQQGYSNVHMINYGGSVYLPDVVVTMVAARHTSSYGETTGAPQYAGEPAGYVFKFSGDHTVYHSGDTCMMADMKLIQDFHKPTIAILSSSGHFVMGPEEAAYCIKNLLDVSYVIPSHSFPNEAETPRPAVLSGLLEAFPVVATMMERDRELQQILADDKKTEVIPLTFGEEREF